MAGFEQSMGKAQRTLDKRLSDMDRRAKAVGKAIGISLGVSIAGALTGAVAGIKGAIDNMDKLRDASIRLGIGVETLSAFQFAAQQTGTDIDALGKGFKLLAKNMADALNPKSGKAQIFDALGISVTDATGKLKQFEQIIPEIANKFKALEDGPTKAALALELFGKSGTELTEFLNQGGDGIDKMIARARELGLVFDQDAADAADKFNDKLGELKAVGTAFFLQLAQNLLPKLDELLTWAQEWVGDGENAADTAREVASAIGDIASALSALRQFVGVLDSVKNGLTDLQEAMADNWFRDAREEFQKQMFGRSGEWNFSGFVEDAEQAKKVAEETEAAATAAAKALTFQVPGLSQSKFDATAPRFTATGTGNPQIDRARLDAALAGIKPTTPKSDKKGGSGKSDEEREAERLQQAYDRQNESLKEQIALFGQDGEAAKLRYELENGELAKLDPLKKSELLARAESLDLMREEDKLLKERAEQDKRAAEEVLRGVEATDAYLQDLQFEIGLLGMTNKERERAIALRYADANATDEQRAAIAQLSDAYYEAREVADFWLEAQHGIADALYDTVTGAKSAGDAVKDFFDNLAKYILRSISENWAERITQLFMGSSMKPTGSVMDPISGGTVSNSGGGFNWASLISAFFGGGRASGGSVNAGMFYRVNENGPELLSVNGSDYLMMGRNSGHVTPNPAAASGFNQTIVNNYRAPYDPRVEAQKAARVGFETSRALTRNGR